MNGCKKCYGVYRYFNYPQNEMCFVVAVNSDEADDLLKSGSIDAVSHWNFTGTFVCAAMKEGLSEAEARRWAQQYEDEYDDAPIGFPDCKVRKINQSR